MCNLVRLRYPRYGRFEIHRRLSMCYSLAIISSAAAAFLSYALGLLGGDRGMSGWRWIFSVAFPFCRRFLILMQL